MNAIETLRQLLTRGSLYTSLGNESLLRIRQVPYFPAPSEPLAKQVSKAKRVFSIHYESASPPSKSASGDNCEEMTESADLGEMCPACGWRFPAIYSVEDRKRHISLQTCQTDKAEYKKLQSEVKKMSQRLEKEPVSLSEDAEMSRKYKEMRVCPKCCKRIEGFWGQLKKRHLEECGKGAHRSVDVIIIEE